MADRPDYRNLLAACESEATKCRTAHNISPELAGNNVLSYLSHPSGKPLVLDGATSQQVKDYISAVPESKTIDLTNRFNLFHAPSSSGRPVDYFQNNPEGRGNLRLALGTKGLAVPDSGGDAIQTAKKWGKTFLGILGMRQSW